MTGRTAIQTGRSDWLNGLLAIFSEIIVGSVAALLFRSYAQKIASVHWEPRHCAKLTAEAGCPTLKRLETLASGAMNTVFCINREC
jgi:hypothetical protein